MFCFAQDITAGSDVNEIGSENAVQGCGIAGAQPLILEAEQGLLIQCGVAIRRTGRRKGRAKSKKHNQAYDEMYFAHGDPRESFCEIWGLGISALFRDRN